ncbi:hypothetical protein LIER_34154 [Lithospermum erythrorhizon]|uniref:Uncharacterized protein n=1 Tax=Lithospermum erythrorhizon TaxID=34254 RepID=A0AAV3S3Q9_LITER
MPWVDQRVAIQRLYVDPHYKPIKQKKWTFSEDKGEVTREEVNKLLGADAIRELLFPTCAGYKVVDFLDTFHGYHEIFMAKVDGEKTAFVSEYDIYCYKVMAFSLNNTGATKSAIPVDSLRPWVVS